MKKDRNIAVGNVAKNVLAGTMTGNVAIRMSWQNKNRNLKVVCNEKEGGPGKWQTFTIGL